MTSAFLTSQHGASFVSTLLTKKGKDSALPDGTLLTHANVVGLYQRYVDLYAASETRSREVAKAKDLCFQFLCSHLAEVLASDARQSIFELSAKALKKLLKNDELAMGSEFMLYILVGVWADRQVTLAAGEEWSFPDVAAEAGAETEMEVEIPDWKFDKDYTLKLRDAMAPLLPHIRFPLMSVKHLAAIEEEGTLVPLSYITEAYRHKALMGMDVYTPDVKNNPRLRGRRYETVAVWDPSWHGQHVTVSADGKTVSKSQAYWYCLAMAKEGYSSGRHAWAIKVNGDEAYIGVARKELTQLDNYLGADANSWSVNNTAYASSGSGSSNRSFGEAFGRGDVIGLVLDMVELKLTYYKNGKTLGDAFTNLPAGVKLYPAVGWRDGTMQFVSPNLDE